MSLDRRPSTSLRLLGFLALPLTTAFLGCGAAPESAPESSPEPVAEAQQAAITCVTVQRGAFGSVSDAQLSHRVGVLPVLDTEGGTNYGALPTALVGRAPAALSQKTLLRFDLSFIPAGATVTSAAVTLATSSTGPGTVSVKRVTAPWLENTVTYKTWANAQAANEEASFVSNPLREQPWREPGAPLRRHDRRVHPRGGDRQQPGPAGVPHPRRAESPHRHEPRQ